MIVRPVEMMAFYQRFVIRILRIHKNSSDILSDFPFTFILRRTGNKVKYLP